MSYQAWNTYFIKNKNNHRQALDQQSEFLRGITSSSQKSIKHVKQVLQPEISHVHNCVAMISVLVVEPDWIAIPCNEKNSNLLICYQKLTKDEYNTMLPTAEQNDILKKFGCFSGQLFIDNQCIALISYKSLRMRSNALNCSQEDIISLPSNTSLFQYFTAIQHFFLYPIEFSIKLHLSHQHISFKAVNTAFYKELKWIKTERHLISYESLGYILKLKKIHIKIPPALFQCIDGSYINEVSMCDEINDCNNGEDEIDCKCPYTLKGVQAKCKYICNTLAECYCSDLFFTCLSSQMCIPFSQVCDDNTDCSDGSDEFCDYDILRTHFYFRENCSDLFHCEHGYIEEYSDTFKNETEYQRLLVDIDYEPASCISNLEIPCIPGHHHCFPTSKLCIYELKYPSLLLKYCRNGAHLHRCDFIQCSGQFKCPTHYCIPYDYVCDGKWDCPGGEDEIICKLFSCSQLFKCKNQTKCLSLSKVCDNHLDCIHGEDEQSCRLTFQNKFICPHKCTCITLSVVCSLFNNELYFGKLVISFSFQMFQMYGYLK